MTSQPIDDSFHAPCLVKQEHTNVEPPVVDLYGFMSRHLELVESIDAASHSAPLYIYDCHDIKLTEPHRPGWALDEWINQISNIPDNIVELANKGHLKIIFHIWEKIEEVSPDEIVSRCEKALQRLNINQSGINIILPTRNIIDMRSYLGYFPSWYVACVHSLYDRRNIILKIKIKTTKRSKKFTCLNRKSRFRSHRLFFCAALFNDGLFDKGYSSFADNSTSTRFRNPEDDNVNTTHCNISIDEFRLNMPFLIDDINHLGHKMAYKINPDFYYNAYWNFVTETRFTIQNQFITEKTFKPLAMGQPFIIVGSPYSLTTLHELGFKTFGEFIDESYDQIEDNTKRLEAVITVAKHLVQMSDEEHMELMAKIKPILEYNRNLFFNYPITKLIDHITK